MRAKLHQVKAELKRRRRDSIPEQGRCVNSVLAGHFRYLEKQKRCKHSVENYKQTSRFLVYGVRCRPLTSRRSPSHQVWIG